MKKILLAYNPISGSATFKKNIDDVVEKFQQRNIFMTLYRTRAENFSEEFTECVKVSGVEGVIAAGGDGTLHTNIFVSVAAGLGACLAGLTLIKNLI